MRPDRYDFSGWATRNDLECSDGRTIRRDAFKDCDGKVVPLVWNHGHSDPENVLGHAVLENRPEGVYTYGVFNDTQKGKDAKTFVVHGDVRALSIYANKLQQKGRDVLHGSIREVSLVLAGANPGAFIDVVLAHSEEDLQEAIVFTGESIELYHADDKKEEPKKEEPKVAEETKEKAPQEAEQKEQPAPKEAEKKEETVKDVIDSMSEEQRKVMYALVGMALEDAGKGEKEKSDMKHNVFEADSQQQENVLSHSDMEAIFSDAKRYGSLKESALAHGVENIEMLFPEAKSVNGNAPEFYKRDDEWVSVIMNGVHHSPFSRIKSMFADITEDDARAKGYLAVYGRDAKGNKVMVDEEGHPTTAAYKKEEVFGLLKRTTTPTTIYKKQKLDRDDVVDITDFDVVSWIKGEMRGMLNEEIARAILIGDGRATSSDEKINEQNIRPIYNDAGLFTIKTLVKVPSAATEDEKAKAFIKAAVKSRKDYKGSGNPVLFTTEEYLTTMLLLEDTIGHRLYKNEGEIASAMRVSKIVTAPVMEGKKDASGNEVIGVIVNLADYNVGADKGGAVNMFDDFDIDYNAQKYLMETRCSGALTKPHSAITVTIKADAEVTAPEYVVSATKNINA